MIDIVLRLAIARRYLIVSLMLGLVGLGVWSYQRLAIDAVPDITNVQVQINTPAEGYSPLEAEQRITFPIETALSGLPSLEYTRSLSRYGLSQITLVFKDGTDIYHARNLINQRLATLRSALPAGIEPSMGPIATGLGEIFVYTLAASPAATQANGNPWDAMALREVQDWIIKPQLAQVQGIVEINTLGGFDKQYHVQPIPERLLTFGISVETLAQALRANNSNRGAGYIERNGQQLLVRSPGQLASIADIEAVVVSNHQGQPITVKDLAEVGIGRELRTGAATRDGQETVLATAMMLQGENSRRVAQAIAQKLKIIQASLPPGVIIESVYDRTTLVDKTIATVQKNLLEGALLVIAVLLLLLGNLRAALITAAVIPLSMLATITGMVQAGVSANLMSLGALDFGLIVDGAVIIVENCTRRLAQAQDREGRLLSQQERLSLVYQATREVIKPSLFGVAIITVVYIPLFALTGVEGKMFHPMAATVVMALLAAMVLSLTLVPAAVALFMKGAINERESRVIRLSKSLYRPVLHAVIRLRVLVVSLAAALIAACLWLASTLGSEFIPQLDEGDIALHAMRIPGTGLEQSIAMQQTLEQHLLTNFPEIKTVYAKIGTAEIATDPMPPNIADSYLVLQPREKWPDPTRNKTELITAIEHSLEQLPGNNYEFTQPIQMRFNELISGVRADVAIKIFGDDLDTLVATAKTIEQLAVTLDGAADVRIEQVTGLPMLSITPKRSGMARYGLTLDQIQEFIAMTIGGETLGLIYEGDRRFQLVVRMNDTLRTNLDALASLPMVLAQGEYVPLGEIADLDINPAPAQISRENGKRRIVITLNVRERDLGGFVQQLQKNITEKITLPDGYWLDYGGTFEQLASASQRLTLVIPITLLVIISLLIMAFGSLKDALIIFTGVPLALTGGILALWLRDMPLSISAGVGFIALSGISVLNGLVMLSFIRERWQSTGDLSLAVIEGALMRLRPVLMTALVAGLGFLPMAFNTGTGAEVQRPIATVVIGGIFSSTCLTLLLLPMLYHWAHQRHAKSFNEA